MSIRDLPIASEAVDLSSADHTFSRTVHAIRAEAAGTFYATLVGEGSVAESSLPYSVQAGDYVLGRFVSVEYATSDAAFQNATALKGVILPKGQTS